MSTELNNMAGQHIKKLRELESTITTLRAKLEEAEKKLAYPPIVIKSCGCLVYSCPECIKRLGYSAKHCGTHSIGE